MSIARQISFGSCRCRICITAAARKSKWPLPIPPSPEVVHVDWERELPLTRKLRKKALGLVILPLWHHATLSSPFFPFLSQLPRMLSRRPLRLKPEAKLSLRLDCERESASNQRTGGSIRLPTCPPKIRCSCNFFLVTACPRCKDCIIRWRQYDN